MGTRRRGRGGDPVGDLLVRAGMPSNVARTLSALIARGEATAADLQRATGLRQPEVSTAVRDLRDRGWVEKEDRKGPGKGRPVHVYRLRKPSAELARDIEADVRGRIRDLEDAIGRLRRALR